MSKILSSVLSALVLFSAVPAFAGDGIMYSGSLNLEFVNLIMRSDVQECLDDVGARSDSMTEISFVSIRKSGDYTSAQIQVTEYRILPTDGRAVKNTFTVQMSSKQIINRGGSRYETTCEVGMLR